MPFPDLSFVRPVLRLLGAFRLFLTRVRLALLQRLSHLSQRSLEHAIFIGGACGVGLVATLFAMLAEQASHWHARLAHQHAWLTFIALPFGLLLLRWITLRFAPNARGSGIPQTLLALETRMPAIRQRYLHLRDAGFKIALTSTALLFGASVGREGPTVQVGAAIMHTLAEKLKLSSDFNRRGLIIAGAAGGIAAAFNTPLAGVVFAIEELSHGRRLHTNMLTLGAVITAGLVSLAMLGHYTYFPRNPAVLLLPGYGGWGAALLASVVCGLCGGMFARLLVSGPSLLLPRTLATWWRDHPLQATFTCGLLLAGLGFATGGQTYGTGYETTRAMLEGQMAQAEFFGVSKFLATVLSYFSGIPGGIFAPSLSIGAGLGQNLTTLFFSASDLRGMALLCMAGFLAGATQAPLTAFVIVMEMTASQDLVVYLMVAAMGASLISRRIQPMPLYSALASNFVR